MKNLKFPLLLFFIALLGLQCEKKFDGVNDILLHNSTKSGKMLAVVDNLNWISNSVSAAVLNGVLNVTGTANDGSFISISISNQAVGTYALSQDSPSVGAFVKPNGGLAYTSNLSATAQGELIITVFDTEKNSISGTFNFRAQNINGALEITDGSFTDIPFITELPNVQGNSLSVDIDGVSYIAESVSGVASANVTTLSAMKKDMSYGVGITFPTDILVGEYDLKGTFSGAGASVLFYPSDVADEVQGSISGTLRITMHDFVNKRIEGTFNCSVQSKFVGSSQLTNGKFASSYTSF